jgi:Type ISP C-terminal specificity domain/N-6 DNA Methylase
VHPLQTYLSGIRRDFGTGQAVKETSYYPHLAALFNAIGATLNPKVFCVVHIANRGAGLPDGGFFTASQRKSAEKNPDAKVKENPLLAMLPERGVLEVKGAAHDLDELRDSAQVKKYLDKYGQVLITNLRQFALLGRDESGKLADVESFTLADSVEKFWKLDPQTFAKNRGEEFSEFLKRCLLSGAPLNSPQDVAAFLASYAREARLRLERIDIDALLPLKSALENVLGVTFEAADSKLSVKEQQERGDRFFRATLVQTLFYGLFSAWLSHVEERPGEPFNWKEAQWSLHVPAVSILFQQLMQPSRLQPLDLRELIELAARTLNRVQTKAFFEKWEGALAVQYFYEPFLEKFDPVLRKELGVYYTPPEIVKYMVERVHRVLQSELNRPLGLADPDVVILDPCCGTGAYVVETLRKIAEELKESSGALLAHDLKAVVLGDKAEGKKPRVFGFEILPAPFVVAHHGVARVLAAYGARLQDDERAPIYLTNALTGWTEEPKTRVLFPELEKERESAQEVKRQAKILVILGNPPYDAFAKITEDPDLVAPYKKGLQSEWGIKKFNLDDLYVRFFRVAERRLTQNGEGVLCFISNFSYLREPSFVVMRQRLLEGFNEMWIDVLNGDSRETGKRTPDGLADPSIFSTPFNPAGIRVGTAINLMVRTPARQDGEIRSRNLWGTRKREELLASLDDADFDAAYEVAEPKQSNRFSLRPRGVSGDYESWPHLTELCAVPPMNGLFEKRGGALIAIQYETLKKRMQSYFDSSTDLSALHRGLASPAARFDPESTRKKVSESEGFRETNLLRYAVRPFDLRWCYFSGVRPLWNEPRPTLHAQLWKGNSFLVSRPAGVANPEGAPLWFGSALGDNDALRGHAYYYPLFLRREVEEDLEIDENGQMQVKTRIETTANLSEKAREYLQSLEFASPDEDAEIAALIWHHALAIGYAPAYRAEHADGLSGDWPRVPLPADAHTLRDSAQLGARVAALLDVAKPLAGVSSAPLRAGLGMIGILTRVDGKQLQPESGDFKITGNWGYVGGRGEVMAGQGKMVERAPDHDERAALDALGLSNETAVCDVYLNDRVYWRAIPRGAWETVIGGYQAMKKWLSYRDFKVLARDLTVAEAREVEAMARRLTMLCALESALDGNYRHCALDVWRWNQPEYTTAIAG